MKNSKSVSRNYSHNESLPHIKAEGIPIWATLFAIFLVIISTVFSIGPILDPSTAFGMNLSPDDDVIARFWAAQNAGLMVVVLLAVILRNPFGYAVAFAGALTHDLGDFLTQLPLGIPHEAPIVMGLLFVLMDIVILVIALRSANSLKRSTV